MVMHRWLAAASMTLAAASFAGCGVGGPPSTIPATGGAAIGAGLGMQPIVRGSSLLPNGKSSGLLYISNITTSSVGVYGLPAWNALGQLLGFTDPSGLCVDSAQNVYVTDRSADRIIEYAHGSVAPIRRLSDRQGHAFTCAVDAKTGNLAVSNNTGPSFGAGNVIVYKAAKGTPTAYAAPNMVDYFFAAYDAGGNLFVDGLNASGNVLLAELPNGKTAFKSIAMSQTISYPGGLLWDGQFLAVGDQIVNVIYQFKVSGSTAVEQGATTLDNAIAISAFTFIGATTKHPQATAVLAADLGSGAAGRWDYPAGGLPVKTISISGTPFGIAVSK